MARPTDLTPELQTKFIELLKRGHFPENVATKLGLDPSTYYGWMRRGRKGEEPFLQFFKSVKAARSEGIGSLHNVIREAADEDPKWAAWMLERSDKRYRPPQTTAHVRTTKDPDKLTDSEYWRQAREQLAVLKELVEQHDQEERAPQQGVEARH